MIQVEHISGTAVFTALADSWDTLAAQGISNTPFQTIAYQQAWFKHLGNGALHTLVVRDKETVIGILPLNLVDGTLLLNASKEETDYLDMIVSAEHAEQAWQAVFAYLQTTTAFAWHTLDLWNLPAWSPSAAIVQAIAAQHGLTATQETAEVCPCIALPATFDDYLAALDKKQRHEIKRKIRRATGAEAVLRVVSADDDIHAAVEQFLALLQSSTTEKGAWLNDGRTALFHDVAAAAQQAGTLQLLFIELEGNPVAALFNLVHDGRTWVYNSGLNPEAVGRLSLGVVISAKAIELAIENGQHTFDFLRGNETYKYRFGAEDTEIYRVTLAKA